MILPENRHPLSGIMPSALLLLVLAGPETEADAVAVAVVAAVDPLVGHAAPLVRRIGGIWPAGLAPAPFPDAVHHEPGAGQDRGPIRQVHGAERLADERARLRGAAERDADQLAAEFVHGHRLRGRRNDRGGERRENKTEQKETSRIHEGVQLLEHRWKNT